MKHKGITYRSMFIFVLVIMIAFLFFWNLQVDSPVMKNSVEKFSVDQSLIKLLLHPGEQITKNIRVRNVWANDLNFMVDFSGDIENILSIDGDSEFSLTSGASKKMNLDITAEADQKPGVYVGNIIIESDEIIEIPVIIEVESDYVFFDSNLNTRVVDVITPGSDIDFSVKIFDMQMGTDPTSVKMEYSLLDMNGNEILSESESVVVLGSTETNKMITLPTMLDYGLYIFTAKAKYGSSTGVSTYLIQVSGYSIGDEEAGMFSACIGNNFCLFGVLSVFLIVMVMLVLLYTISLLKPRDRRHREKIIVMKGFAKAKKEHVKEIVSNVSAPSIKLPKIKFPRIRLPRLRAPRVKIPRIKVPRLKLPRVRVPKLKVPRLRLPRLRMPKLNLPQMPKKPIAETAKDKFDEKAERFKDKHAEVVNKIKNPNLGIPPLRVKMPVPKIRLPRIKLPRVKIPRLPRIKLPRVKIPRVRVPRIKLPRIKLPKVRVPRVKAPRLPRIKAPRIKLPKIRLPKIKVPKFDLPEIPGMEKDNVQPKRRKVVKKVEEVREKPRFEMPKVSMPKFKAPKMPKIKLPTFRMPKINVPKIRVPKIPKIKTPELPKIKAPQLPKVKSPFGIRDKLNKVKKKLDEVLGV
jgi:hypothetical protein